MYSKKLNMKDPIYSMPENALTIALSADHAGYELKTKLLKWLEEQGYQTLDLGTNSEESVDYPDYGAKLGGPMRNCNLRQWNWNFYRA